MYDVTGGLFILERVGRHLPSNLVILPDCSMLEEFEREMEDTDSRLRSLTSRVNKAIRKSGGKLFLKFLSLVPIVQVVLIAEWECVRISAHSQSTLTASPGRRHFD